MNSGPASSIPITIEGREVAFPGSPVGSLHTKIFLACLVKPLIHTYEAEWILPNNTVISSSMSRHRFYEVQKSSGFQTNLLISAVSYADAGIYMCRARDTSRSNLQWISANIEIKLPGNNMQAVSIHEVFYTLHIYTLINNY